MATSQSFPLVGEPVSLDLVNTRVRSGGTQVDLLDGPPALAVWLRLQAGRLPWSGTVTPADLLAVRALRDAIATLLAAHSARTRPPRRALATVNDALAVPLGVPQLVWTAQGPQTRARTVESQRNTLLYKLAVDAITVLTGPDADLLHTCEHPDCLLQFLARNPRRRWCTATCGNRARVARHYSRRQVRP